jgi:protoporphyrinogen oxidase
VSTSENTHPVAVIGAGPAGLTAAYELVKRGRNVIVFEGSRELGGISRTVERDGWRFDIGGHRFFTKVEAVNKLWHEILPPEDFLLRPRMSRIFFDGKYYDYPLKASNALKNLGLFEAGRCVLSYIWAQIRRPKDQSNYEGWLVSRFGWRLYRKFFKTYTEKVWGVPVRDMPADWAAQRVKGLNLGKAILNSLTPSRNQKEITSLIEEFEYPKYGPGMMWERCAELVVAAGGQVMLGAKVTGIKVAASKATSLEVAHDDGRMETIAVSDVITTNPMRELVAMLDPQPPADVARAGADLSYRDFLTVALVVPDSSGFPDNWIYIHSQEVAVGRIQNYGSWSPFMVKENKTCLGLEFFVFEGDELWNADDDALIAQGIRELDILGLVKPEDVERGFVVRVPKAYPYYDAHYAENVARIVGYLEGAAPNIHPVGRNGMHKYNNQDHSMYTALLTVENLEGASHDIWQVNVEAEYHEEASTRGGTGRDAPILPKRPSSPQ